jgi:hypothetical protein
MKFIRPLPKEVQFILHRYRNCFLLGSAVDYHLGLSDAPNDDYDISVNNLFLENVKSDLITHGYQFLRYTNFGGISFVKGKIKIDCFNLFFEKIFCMMNHKTNQHILDYDSGQLLSINLQKVNTGQTIS